MTIFKFERFINLNMPSVYQFLENSEIFPSQSTLSENPDILNCLIDYITKNPDPLIHNEQQCYVYPNKSAEILSLGTAYRAVIVKRERKNKKTNETQYYYPFLDRAIKNLQTNTEKIQQCLLGYFNRVLISFAKKTPEIYEYVKDNQEIVNLFVKNNRLLKSFKDFWVTFLVQSTMGLYMFLKNIVIRSLMFRIIDEKDTNNLVAYQTLYVTYWEVNKKLKATILPQDEKEELQEIASNFHDQDFISLLILKISHSTPNKTYFISKLINEILTSPNNQIITQFSISQMEIIEEYFQSYQESSLFLDYLASDQIEMLKFLTRLSENSLLQLQFETNLLKRLLVYASIHKKNSILHNVLFKHIQTLAQKEKIQVLSNINIISFLMKNRESKQCKHSYGGLVWRVCEFWQQNEDKLGQLIEEDEKKFIREELEKRSKKFIGLNMYKQISNKTEIVAQNTQSIMTSPTNEKDLQEKDSQQSLN